MTTETVEPTSDAPSPPVPSSVQPEVREAPEPVMDRSTALGNELALRGYPLPAGEKAVDKVAAPGGGWYYLTDLGGVYALDGAPYLGSYLGLPPEGRQGQRTFGPGGLEVSSTGGYTLRSAAGEAYQFSAPTPTSVAPMPDSAEVQSASSIIRDTLGRYGLGDLTDWALGQIKSGAPQTIVLEQLRQTDQYKTRFAGMAKRQAAGFNAISEEEYLAYETTIASYLQQAGLPRDFYDTPADFADLIGKFANPLQVADRVQKGYAQVAAAAPEVRSAFADYFGPMGDSALAAFFLDPEKAQPALEQMVATAGVGGAARRTAVDVSVSDATRIAQLGLSQSAVQQGMGQVYKLNPVFSETASETTDLTQKTGTDAVFGLDPNAEQQITDRLQGRQAALGAGGGAVQTTTGAIGLGEQRSQR